MDLNIKGYRDLHELHASIGDLIEDNLSPSFRLIRDMACIRDEGVKQQIPLFCSDEKSNKTKYCNVDLLIIQDGKIRVIVEIEESDVKPTQICGKFLTSALARYYIHETEGNVPIGMHDSVTFIQVVDTSKLKNLSAKPYQWKYLESSIGNILPIKDSNIKEYRLFTDLELKELFNYIFERIGNLEMSSTEKCPGCGTPMINAPFPILGGDGVGYTTSIDTKRPAWGTEKVCPKCGITNKPAPTRER